jgi:hypothetical protein
MTKLKNECIQEIEIVLPPFLCYVTLACHKFVEIISCDDLVDRVTTELFFRYNQQLIIMMNDPFMYYFRSLEKNNF